MLAVGLARRLRFIAEPSGLIGAPLCFLPTEERPSAPFGLLLLALMLPCGAIFSSSGCGDSASEAEEGEPRPPELSSLLILRMLACYTAAVQENSPLQKSTGWQKARGTPMFIEARVSIDTYA
jgi:hypothetical protein